MVKRNRTSFSRGNCSENGNFFVKEI